MTSAAVIRDQLRPHGTLALGCPQCSFFSECGGIEWAESHLDCFAPCQRDCDACDIVCPYSNDFCARLREIGGLRFDNLTALSQRPGDLPHYVPLIHHSYRRSGPLEWPVVAIETYQIFRKTGGRYTTIAHTPAELRRAFALDLNTRVLLRGTAGDAPLETYWSHRRRDDAPGQLAALGVDLAIGPNFSHFLDVPRTDNLFNRKRQLICLQELSEAGLSPVPHLSAVTSADWGFWREYLLRNDSVVYVAAEFQTGNKNKDEGLKVVRRMAWLQDQIGRSLHPLIVGGAQFLEEVAARFKSFTLVDSRPFMNAVKRQRFAGNGVAPRWVSAPTLPGVEIDALVAENVAGYSEWVGKRGRLSARRRVRGERSERSLRPA